MPTIRPIELSDRSIINAYLRRYPPQVSELTFTNLFVWRHSRPVFFTEIENTMVFLTESGLDKQKFILGHPLGEAFPLNIANNLDVDVTAFVRIPEQTASALKEGGLAVDPDRDNADYVYRVADLAELAGRRYHKKRNLVKQCLGKYLPI